MKTRRLTLDLHPEDRRPPQRDDRLYGARAIYRVLDAREVDSKVWVNRWALVVERIGTRGTPPLEDPPEGARAFHFTTYRPGETPREAFRTRGIPA